MFWLFDKNLRDVRKLMALGELHSACDIALQTGCLSGFFAGRTGARLVNLLVDRANKALSQGDVHAAWQDLNDAVSVSRAPDRDRLAREQTRLIEATIASAEESLTRGQFGEAARAIRNFRTRRIADRRSDVIERICNLAQEAKVLAEAGRWRDSSARLELAGELRPDLTFLESRIRANEQEEAVVRNLTNQLCTALTASDWQGVRECSGKILQVAPRCQVALDARERCDSHYSGGDDQKHVIASDDTPASSGDTVYGVNDRDTRPNFFSSRRPLPGPEEIHDGPAPELSANPAVAAPGAFMLWIDGVGGFLVCTRQQVTIGRSGSNSEADIPIHADIRRKQLAIRRLGEGFVALPLDKDGEIAANNTRPGLLRHGQRLDLGAGLVLQIHQPLSLGNSLRIEVVSRHRTDPWADSILLLGNALLLGNTPRSHVQSPKLIDEFMIFRRGPAIFLRLPGVHELDGEYHEGDIPVEKNFRVVSDNFSATVEIIGSTDSKAG
jgi:hypothetical protein